jgi:dihydrodipicolinate synthase/N-acetylneuraminate lyase
VNHIRRILKDGGDLSLFKAVLTYRGIPCGGVRAPLLNASSETIDAAINALLDQGIALTPA